MNAFVLLVATLGALQTGATRSTGVRLGVTVSPTSVRIGQPATLTVRVQAPAGTKITFPPAVDSTANVEPLDPVSVREETRNGFVDATATYRFLTWQVGDAPIPVSPIRLERDGAVQELTIGDPMVSVVSVLPADTALRVPKPARDISLLQIRRWPWWLLIALGFAVASLGGWLLERRTKRPPPPIEPFVDAQRAFGRLGALDLIGAGEPAKYVGASADILRTFLAARDANAAPGRTTSELLIALRKDARVPASRIAAMLASADSIKFAGGVIDAATAEALGAEASAIVLEIHRRDHKAPK
jgi:hypothetical protein